MIRPNTNPRAERAVPYFVDEADILKDILKALNRQAKREPHKPMQQILDDSLYHSKWKNIIGYEGRRFEPTIKIERRKKKITNNINN